MIRWNQRIFVTMYKKNRTRDFFHALKIIEMIAYHPTDPASKHIFFTCLIDIYGLIKIKARGQNLSARTQAGPLPIDLPNKITFYFTNPRPPSDYGLII